MGGRNRSRGLKPEYTIAVMKEKRRIRLYCRDLAQSKIGDLDWWTRLIKSAEYGCYSYFLMIKKLNKLGRNCKFVPCYRNIVWYIGGLLKKFDCYLSFHQDQKSVITDHIFARHRSVCDQQHRDMIFSWSIIAKRIGVHKDISNIIAKLVWNHRKCGEIIIVSNGSRWKS